MKSTFDLLFEKKRRKYYFLLTYSNNFVEKQKKRKGNVTWFSPYFLSLIIYQYYKILVCMMHVIKIRPLYLSWWNNFVHICGKCMIFDWLILLLGFFCFLFFKKRNKINFGNMSYLFVFKRKLMRGYIWKGHECK